MNANFSIPASIIPNPSSLRVLYLEDVPRDADLAIHELVRSGIECEGRVVCSREDMLRELSAFHPDIILSDYAMPQFGGMEALDIRNERAPYLPFIVVTGSINEETATACIKRGADDYVTKDHLIALPRAVGSALEKKRLEHAEREAGENVRRAAKQWHTTFDAIGDAVALLDGDLKILRCNETMRRMIGTPWDRIIGQPYYRLIHKTEAPPLSCPVLPAGRTLRRETVRMAAGNRWFDFTADPVLDEDGRLINIVYIAKDITQHKQAEERRALHAVILGILNRPNEWEVLVRDLLLEIKAFTGFDAVGIRLRKGDDFPYFVQTGFSEAFVREENTLICRQGDKIVRSSSKRVDLACICGLVIGGDSSRDDSRFTPKGSFWSNDTRSLLEFEAGQIPMNAPRNRCAHEGYRSVALIPLRTGDEIIGLMQLNDKRPGRFMSDMVDFFEEIGNSIGVAFSRMQAREALAASEKRYRALFEGVAEGILVVDVECRGIRYANPGICCMLGYSADELLRLTVSDIHPMESLSDVLSAFDAHARGVRKMAAELPCLRKDGAIIFADIHSARIEIDPRPSVVGFFTDVTEKVRLEAKKGELETQLRQAQKMESIGRLAGGVAHDYNNMLSVIMGFAEMALDREGLDEALRSDLKEILMAAKRSTSITRQLLVFARQQPVALKVLELNSAVEQMFKMLRRLIGEDVDLIWHPGAGVGAVKMDPSQIDQILANLCVNARDAIPDVGKIVIETDTAVFDEVYCLNHAGVSPGEYVVLTVTDDGCGMEKDVADQIFEPFFSTKGEGRGTGLGLATVYGIVKQNNGAIDVASEPGKGAAFRIYLPVYKGRTIGEDGMQVEDIPRGQGETILVAEDEPAAMRLVGRMLSELGYTVLTANSPSEALRLAESRTAGVSLLITDVVMPDLNGRQLSEQLDTVCPGLKCLFMSGYTAEIIAERGMIEEGMNFIQKPFSKKDLAVKIRKLMEDGESADEVMRKD